MKSNIVLKLATLSVYLLNIGSLSFADECCIPDSCDPCCESHYTLGAEWLYWQVKEDNLRAGSFVDDFPDPVLKTVDASVITPKFEPNNGFRVYAGYEFPCSEWEIGAAYTYMPLHSKSDFREVIPVELQTEEHRQFIVPNNIGFPSFNAFGNDSGLVVFTSMFTKWGGNFSYVDIDLARSLTFCPSFKLRPHIGFRAAWSKQHLHMQGGLLFSSVNESTFGSIKFSQTFQGYGIEGGCWADWQLGYGFSLIGHVGGSILYTQFKFRSLAEASLGEDGDVVFIINANGKITTGIPTMDYFAGILYETEIGQFVISAHAGWEQKIFFNMNQLSTNNGNLIFQGLTFGGNIGF